MLVQLLGYEFYKKWKVSKYILGGFIVLQVLLLTISRVFLWNDGLAIITMGDQSHNPSFTLVLIMILYLISAVGIFFFPFIESAYRYEKDLSGKQAVLELMIPVIAWKKILSKLIVTLCTTTVFQIMAVLSIVAFILVNSNFNKEIVDPILNNVSYILSSPAKSAFVAIYMLFVLASLYIIIMFCIAFSKSISHKNRIAVPIGIGMFIACFVVRIVIEMQIEKFPIVKFDLLDLSLSSMIVDILFFAILFLGASFLMEKRIEN